MANFTAVGDVGRIILAAIVTYLAVRLGWRWTSLLFGLAAVIISSLIGLKSYSVSKSVNVDDHSLKGIPEILKSRAFLLAMTAFTLDTLASSGLFIFLPFVLLTKQIDPTVLGAMAGFYFVGNIVGKVTIGNAVDRYGYRLVISTAEVFMAILLVMLALAQSWGRMVNQFDGFFKIVAECADETAARAELEKAAATVEKPSSVASPDLADASAWVTESLAKVGLAMLPTKLKNMAVVSFSAWDEVRAEVLFQAALRCQRANPAVVSMAGVTYVFPMTVKELMAEVDKLVEALK